MEFSSAPAWQLVLALLVQLGGIIWWASGINRRIKVIEDLQSARTPLIERFVKAEARVEQLEYQYSNFRLDINRRLDRIEQKLDSIIERERER